MDAKKLEIQTLSVQIKVLTIDQKRFTKAVFDQLHSISVDYVRNDDFSGFRIDPIGYVLIKDEPIPLFDIDGDLCKCYKPSSNAPYSKGQLHNMDFMWASVPLWYDQLFISI